MSLSNKASLNESGQQKHSLNIVFLKLLKVCKIPIFGSEGNKLVLEGRYYSWRSEDQIEWMLLLCSAILYKTRNIRTHQTEIIRIILWGCETWKHCDEHNLRVSENTGPKNIRLALNYVRVIQRLDTVVLVVKYQIKENDMDGTYRKHEDSMSVVRKRTIPTERGQRNEFPRPLISVF
jgi:hypothetical protein